MSNLTVVNEQFTDRTGVVTVQGPTQESVTSSAAKQLAIQAGSTKLARCGVSGNEVAYPVDSTGETSDDLILKGGDVAAYRCDYNLASGL